MYYIFRRRAASIEQTAGHGSIAQLGEHLPYKQRVTGSSPVVPTKVADSVFMPL